MHVTVYGWAYIGTFVIAWRIIAGAVYRNDQKEGELAAVFTGFCAAWFWPLILAVWLIYKACMRWPNGMRRIFIHETSRARRERKLEQARERVAQLEKDLGL